MPTFKPKATKKIKHDEKTAITLDNKHHELLKKFEDNKNIKIPQLKEKRKILKERFKSDDITVEDKLEIKDELENIKKTITRLKQEEKEYFLNNSKFIFEYFENKNNISKGENETKVLDDFFKIKKKEKNTQEDKNDTNIQKYLSNIDETFIDTSQYIQNDNICKHCKKGELIPVDYEGVLICNNCSRQIKYLIENEKPSYKEPPKEVCFYAYKRINHFREILAQFQAKETTQIPDEVLQNVKNQIKKERIDIKKLTNKDAKEILKKLGYNKYYEHIPFIKDKLGIRPPVMSPELEDKLCNLFMEIQRPYAKYCPDDRVNFLNYYYTVYKLCELLDQKQFLPYFPMLKDRQKRIEQDEIWKKICIDLNWQFIPTI